MEKVIDNLTSDELTEMLQVLGEKKGLEITLKPASGGDHSQAYYNCLAAHAGQCGTCSETGAFTPCG